MKSAGVNRYSNGTAFYVIMESKEIKPDETEDGICEKRNPPCL